jgi:hypothetical protein
MSIALNRPALFHYWSSNSGLFPAWFLPRR